MGAEQEQGGRPGRAEPGALAGEPGAERERVASLGHLEDGSRQAGGWYRWGPHVSERQRDTVREDCSPDGQAWNYFPHDLPTARTTPYPKDGIGDHAISGAAAVNPDRSGTKCASWHQLTVPAGQTTELRLRPAGALPGPGPLGAGFEQVITARRAEADEFYAALTPAGTSAGAQR